LATKTEAKKAEAPAPKKAEAPATPKKRVVRRKKKVAAAAGAYDWLEALLVAEAHGTISSEGKATLKRVRAKAKDGSEADAATLRRAEENIKSSE
jgi:hypothetical protein